jgi:hypothetical protein
MLLLGDDTVIVAHARIRQHLKPHEQRLLRLRLDLRTAREKAEQAWVEAEQARIKATRQAYVLASRYNRERLYQEVWSEPVVVVAKKYDVGLAKICKKLNIPRPGLGYWAKMAAGKYVGTRPPLPSLPGFCRN